jgi:hypothetical protein
MVSLFLSNCFPCSAAFTQEKASNMTADDKKLTNGEASSFKQTETSTMADKNQRQLGLADAGMLKKIDSLFQCNVGHYISLPQIVVVGNQSSGKSSVLEGLTNLPFPKDSGLCTRFATQITFKRVIAPSIRVKIIPAKDADNEHILRCRSWKKTMDALDKEHFLHIMTQVSQRPA